MNKKCIGYVIVNNEGKYADLDIASGGYPYYSDRPVVFSLIKAEQIVRPEMLCKIVPVWVETTG